MTIASRNEVARRSTSSTLMRERSLIVAFFMTVVSRNTAAKTSTSSTLVTRGHAERRLLIVLLPLRDTMMQMNK
jgi:hypothetical protein